MPMAALPKRSSQHLMDAPSPSTVRGLYIMGDEKTLPPRKYPEQSDFISGQRNPGSQILVTMMVMKMAMKTMTTTAIVIYDF